MFIGQHIVKYQFQAAPVDGECYEFTFSSQSLFSGMLSSWPGAKKINVLVDGEVYASKSSGGSVCIEEGKNFDFRYIHSNLAAASDHEATIEWTRPSSNSLCFFCYSDYYVNIFTQSSGMVYNVIRTQYTNGMGTSMMLTSNTVMVGSTTMYSGTAAGHDDILGTDSDDEDSTVH